MSTNGHFAVFEEERALPFNREAEESVLGCFLIDEDAYLEVASFLRPEHFYQTTHRRIYEAVVQLFEDNRPVDYLTVYNQLQANGVEIDVAELLLLVQAVPTSLNAAEYGRIVHDLAQRRALINAAGQIAKLAYQEGDVDAVVSESGRLFQQATESQIRPGPQSIRDVVSDVYDQILDNREHGVLPGYSTGLTDLDKLLRFQKEQFILIGGRPGMGKSALLNTITLALLGQGLNGLAVDMEMSKEQKTIRMISQLTNLPYKDIESGTFEEEHFTDIARAVGKLSEYPLKMDNWRVLASIETEARRLYVRGELDFITVDYIQLMWGDKYHQDDVSRVSFVSRGLKALAMELHVPVIAAAQLGRQVDTRHDKRPVLSDLKESGCLTGDTLVSLADSGEQVPLREMIGKEGIKVWAMNPTTYRLEPAIVSNAFSTGVKPVYRLRTRLGHTIRATVNHKFYTINGWKRLDELVPGQHIAVPRVIPESLNQADAMGESEIKLLAHLIGDGCTLPEHVLQYTTAELELAKLVTELAIDVFGDRVAPRINQERQWYQVYLPSAFRLTHGVRNPVGLWLDELGHVWGRRSYQKQVPNKVFRQDNDRVSMFLRHLWATDGCASMVIGKSPRPNVYYSTSSKQLAYDVQTLLRHLGIVAHISQVKYQKSERAGYHVRVTGREDVLRFADVIGVPAESVKSKTLEEVKAFVYAKIGNTNRDIIPHHIWDLYARPAMRRGGVTYKAMFAAIDIAMCGSALFKQNVSRERAARVAKAVGSVELNTLATSDLYWDQIVSVEPDGEEEVFDLTVPGPHNFIADGIVVHNSLEQDGDAVIFIYRDDYYNPNSPVPGQAELIVAKHRNGPVGTAKVLWQAIPMAFRNLAHRSDWRPS